MNVDFKKNADGKCILCWGNGQVINSLGKLVKCTACGGNFREKEGYGRNH